MHAAILAVVLVAGQQKGSVEAYRTIAGAERAAAEERMHRETLVPSELEIGQIGPISRTRSVFVVSSILSPTELIAHNASGTGKRVTVIVTKTDTSKLVDGKPMTDAGLYRVSGTRQLKTPRTPHTVFVIEPLTGKELAAYQAKLQDEANAKAAARKKEQDAIDAAKQARAKARQEAADKKAREIATAKAAARLRFAKKMLEDNPGMAKARLQEIVKEYPCTPAAKEAKAILERIK